ncbi:unnamed protein product [Caenorhabditis bovis]|uniref:Uncharacterized protein n=1 Tax=Caenorhabditis bovis TaxID=2654633 RepID=A0A8S1F1A5_9PELO|nr:unnamed protein product [Caenorhabditis bovis]
MGIVNSLIFPKFPEECSKTNSRGKESFGPPGAKKTVSNSVTTDSSEIKYLEKTGPPTVLGPTPGNVPVKNPLSNYPTIKPPKDTNEKVASDLSEYDTLAMAPDVFGEKKSKK